MDFDDLDGEEIPTKAPARAPKFAPRGANKPKSVPAAKPKVEEPAPKPEPERPSDPTPSLNTEEDVVEDVKPSIRSFLEPKAEASISNAAAKMEVEDKPEEKPEPMDEDSGFGDEVVREIDVYFNPSIGDNTELFVMQYPLRPWWRPYELDERCDKVRVKPVSARVEVDLSMDVESTNFDAECNSKYNMKKQTLASCWKAPHATSYAVGILTGNKLHLNPIHAIVQLRPSMEHLKPGALSMKSNASSSSTERVKTEAAEPSKKQGKQLEHSNEEGTDGEEDWVSLEYHGSKSDLAGKYLQKLTTRESFPIQFTMNPYDYVNSLCPGAASHNRKPEGALKRTLLSLPLEDRIKKFLCEAPQIHRYSALRHYTSDASEEQLLGVLQRNAHLVQGCWVLRTVLMYEQMCRESFARDYTLLLFSKKSVIHSSVLHGIKKFLSDGMKKFLNTFGIERPSLADWKFKLPTDVSFLKKYPDIVKEQEQKWEGMQKNIMETLEKLGKGGDNKANVAARLKQSTMASKEARSTANMEKAAAKVASGGGTTGGRRTMSDETREALPKALQKIFQNHKVCSFELICQSLRDLAVSQSSLPKADPRMAIAAAHGVDAPRAELTEVINTVATEIHGVYVSKSSPEHSEYDSLRKVVINLLIGKGPNASLKKAEIYKAASMALNREISNIEYTKVMSELCESKSGSWYLRKSN